MVHGPAEPARVLQGLGRCQRPLSKLHWGAVAEMEKYGGLIFPQSTSAQAVLMFSTQILFKTIHQKMQLCIPLTMSAFVPPRAATRSQAISSLRTETVTFPPLMGKALEQTGWMSELLGGGRDLLVSEHSLVGMLLSVP